MDSESRWTSERDGQTDIFVYELARGTLIRVTSESGNEEYPVWTPRRQTHRISIVQPILESTGTRFPGSPLMARGDAQILTESTDRCGRDHGIPRRMSLRSSPRGLERAQT